LSLLLLVAVSCSVHGITGAQYDAVASDANHASFYEASLATEPYQNVSSQKVRNVIFCIGDGMGLGQTTLARMKTTGANGVLHLERLPIVGIMRTHSANSLVTDSAASGTAMASGVKTNNGMIGMTPDGTKYQTILEATQAKRMTTGLVATSTITHATPAAFASHVKSRGMQGRIAEQLIANRVNIILGGGRQCFLPKSHPDSKRKDELNLIEEAEKAGYLYIQTPRELRTAQHTHVLGLFQVGPLTTTAPEPSLAELTAKAVSSLSQKAEDPNKPGFFLMIEGSQIDWACHHKDPTAAIRQTLLFDQAVKAAIDFARKDAHTLVVVTADHETGGLTITGGRLNGNKLSAKWSTGGHSALPVPVYAYGPKANIFGGVYDNTAVAKRFAHVLGITSFPGKLRDRTGRELPLAGRGAK
jgi:alkaline phosphatase